MYAEKHKNPAIVIGGGVNGLGIIRCLGKKGIDVYCAVDKKDEAIYSKYCKKSFIIPGVEHNLKILEKFLTDFEKSLESKAVIFPVSDISILNISYLIDKFENYCISISDKSTLEKIIKKKNFYKSLVNEKLPHPKTYIVNGQDNLDSISKKVNYPVFIKPSMSQVFLEKFDGKKAFIAHSKNELDEYIKIVKKQNIDVMIQEMISGPATNHYFIDGYFDKKSKPMAIFARKRIRIWPPYYGNSTVCKSIDISKVKEMKEITISYLSKIGFKGIFSAEFKINEKDNKAKIIEINARSWWYNSFPANCGIDIIFMAYLDALDEKIEPIKRYKTDVNLIYLLEDLNWAFTMFSKHAFSFKEWKKPFKEEKYWAVLLGDDIKPFIMSVTYLLKNSIFEPKLIAKKFKKRKDS